MHNLHCSGDFMSVEKMLRETCGLTRVEVGGIGEDQSDKDKIG